jgi:siroheme synthase (precorrin-2 oxidase/ferrochelatase)
MSDPLVHAFFVGRAIAEAINEQVESAVTSALSELGKFDAEQRERIRNFSADVAARAAFEEERVAQATANGTSSPSSSEPSSEDVQSLIDDLRAEIAQLRSELQRYRSTRS